MKSLTGHELRGNKLVRFTYMDESGNEPRAPVVVVATAIIDFDKQLEPIETYMDSLVQRYAPEFGENFYFHATDIWNGNGEFFKEREKDWPFTKRIILLERLVNIFIDLDIPISYGKIIKSETPIQISDEFTKNDASKTHQTLAYAQACAGVEVMFRQCLPEERTAIIAERCDHIEKDLKEMHQILRSPKKVEKYGLKSDTFPFHHINETIMFVGKKESKALQLADFTSFIIRKYYEGGQYNRRSCIEYMFGKILPKIIQLEKQDGSFILAKSPPLIPTFIEKFG
jgi:hypothetical protein